MQAQDALNEGPPDAGLVEKILGDLNAMKQKPKIEQQ